MLAPLSLSLVIALASQNAPSPLQTEFEKLDQAGESAKVVELFRRTGDGVMGLIDSYLEGSLSAWEKATADGGSVDDATREQIAAMHARALRGARAAAEAFHSPDIVDYAASFVGWNDDQKVRFRNGQRACGAAGRALREKDFEKAMEHAHQGLEYAWGLGDWWGTAMALSRMGRAYEGLGKPEEALRSLSSARIFFHGLALYSSAYQLDVAMLPLMIQLDRIPRAEETIARALAASDGYNDPRSRVRILEQRAVLEEKRGHSDAAAGTRAEIEALLKTIESSEKESNG
ncbi:MAG: hypothetical protein KDC38_18225 [Planctomycetes bacterium]|nr:hypothetical protein [Planctomycetota bacterium]